MVNLAKSKFTASFLIVAFILFYSPHLFAAKAANSGNLIGFIYGEDGLTPVENAVVKIRNVSTGTEYQSTATDKLGIFKIEGIKEGLYMAGISTQNGDFNLNNLIGIQANQTGKITLALRSVKAQEEPGQRRRRGAGFFLSPAGIAIIVAATAALIYTIVKLTEEEAEASPIK